MVRETLSIDDRHDKRTQCINQFFPTYAIFSGIFFQTAGKLRNPAHGEQELQAIFRFRSNLPSSAVIQRGSPL